MKVCVLANDEQREELLTKPVPEGTQFIFATDLHNLSMEKTADLYIILTPLQTFDVQLFRLDVPIILNSTDHTLQEMNASKNIHRIIGWNTFLSRDVWEIASRDFLSIERKLDELTWKSIHVSDQPGLISARVVGMIINEAYMTWEEGVSTKDDIDIAMKLGTNYPFGPFEWSSKIGPGKILSLLQKLAAVNECYSPSKSLINESE